MGFVDTAFKTVKRGQSNFLIWRVENFEVKPLPETRYGSFYEGDAYLVYSASPAPGQTPSKNDLGKLEYHIHFWLGATSSADEGATAAIKAVELDDWLNGICVQHREIQGHESNKFKSYFKNGLRILKGGVASGLHHVSDSFTPRLFKIKGKRRPTMTEQPAMSWDYFNSGDVFLLESKNRIFVWVGKDSNKMEKFQAGKVAAQLRVEGKPRSVVFIDEDKESNLAGDDLTEFEEHLKMDERVVKSAERDLTDAEDEQSSTGDLRLYKCTDENGTFNTTFVKDGPLKQSDLGSMDSYIVLNGSHGVWLWIGKKASADERSKGMSTAYDFLKKEGKSATASVSRVVDGGEPVEFQMLFSDWKVSNATLGYTSQVTAKKTVNIDFNAAKLHEMPHLAAETQLVDNGSGTCQVWRLRNKELEEVPEDHFGLFFSGDCYLILYTYDFKGRQKHLLYYWLGAHSSLDERGAVAWHAVKKDEDLKGKAIQVRVVQSKEDPQFLMIFKGKMIIFKGGYASAFDGAEGKNTGIPSKFLIHVRGSEEYLTQSVEVDFSATSLNTNDVFVLYHEKRTYVWCGKGSTGDERERAKDVANQWSATKEHQVIFEGYESPEFWEILGGKQPYANVERLANSENEFPARLFHCSNSSGYFKAEEIVGFSQYDLVPNDVMVLDIGSAVFIWVGRGANKGEREKAPKLVEDYLKTDPRGRDLDCPVITVKQGFEPPNFTGFFGPWDKRLWESSLYLELGSDTVVSEPGTPVNDDSPVPCPQDSVTDSQEDSSPAARTNGFTIYPMSELANKRAEQVPEDVDVLHKEFHLSVEEFEAAFGMNRSDYEALPTWKQDTLKKKVGLF